MSLRGDVGRTARDLERQAAALAAQTAPPPAPEPLVGTILDTMALFGDLFAGESWAAWRAFLTALFGLPLAASDLAIYTRHTGRPVAPAAAVREAWAVVGRRGGKSRIAALVAVHLATRDYRHVLAPGEVGTLPVLAADRAQSRTVFRYIVGLLDAVPALRALVARRLKESLLLTTGVRVEVHSAHYGRVRGYTLVGAVCDELAFWPTSDESANPDTEIVAALRPAMATVPGAVLLALSTPYARRGALYEAHQRWYGSAEPEAPLVWQAETRAMNPTVPVAVVARAYADDPAAAASEYGAAFRSDIEGFLTHEAVVAVVAHGRRELPPARGCYYRAFTDPSGGSQDSFTLAVAHFDGARAVLDCVREVRPPFSPDAVCEEFAGVLASYGLTEVHGDRYGGTWPAERFAVHGVRYTPTERTKSQLYQGLLPAVNAGRVELLDHPKLVAQLVGLERRVSRAGQDSIDHTPGGHDDVANAVAGALGAVLVEGDVPAWLERAFREDIPAWPLEDWIAEAAAERAAEGGGGACG